MINLIKFALASLVFIILGTGPSVALDVPVGSILAYESSGTQANELRNAGFVFTHVVILLELDGEPYVVEATGGGIRKTPLRTFYNETWASLKSQKKDRFVMVPSNEMTDLEFLEKRYQQLLAYQERGANGQTFYDSDFAPDNKRFYCSEFVESLLHVVGIFPDGYLKFSSLVAALEGKLDFKGTALYRRLTGGGLDVNRHMIAPDHLVAALLESDYYQEESEFSYPADVEESVLDNFNALPVQWYDYRDFGRDLKIKKPSWWERWFP